MRLLVTVTTILAATFLQPFSAFAEIKTITHTVQQPFGGSQSPDDARTAGIARAKREALEQFGTYIESTTIVKNSQVDSDEILALTAGVTKVEVVKQKNYTDGNGFGLEITVKVDLDTSVLEKSLKRLLDDRSSLKELKASREREMKLLTRIAKLEKQNRLPEKTKQQEDDLIIGFEETSNGLSAVALYDKLMYSTIHNNNLHVLDIPQIINSLSEVIRLDPTHYEAYANRGVFNSLQDKNQEAIKDFDQAIRLNPTYSTAYLNRGESFFALKQYQPAITDFAQVIRLEPKEAWAYARRGKTYIALEQYQQAIQDFNFAIHLDPKLAFAYTGRGRAYILLGLYKEAIKDLDKANKIDPKLPEALNLRGLAYIQLGKANKGCADLKKACKLGECGEYETVRQNNLCD